MTTTARISERVEQQGVLVVECSIPEDMTIAEWRALRPRAGRRRSRRRRATTADAPRHLVAVPDATCDHLHDTTSRYDRVEKQLTFLLVCRICETEKVVETIAYEPLGEHASSQAA
jgi:hypothetical protein